MRSSAPATRANCAAPSTAASRWACPPPRTWSCSPTCCLRSARAFPTSTWKSSTASSAGRGALLDGSMDFTSVWRRARAGRAAGREAVRQYRVILGRRATCWRRRNAARTGRRPLDHHVHHPQGRGRTGPAVRKHGLPAPKLAMRAQSALTFLTALPSSDLLMMLPVQWLRYPLLTRSRKSRSGRSCPRRPFASCSARTALTPAAEHYCIAALRRAAGHIRK